MGFTPQVKTTEGSYAEIEGLLINLGVVAALMLSFVVGVFFTIPREEFFYGDYRHTLMHNTDFRMYAESMLDYQGFNFTAPFPLGTGYELVDMRQIMHQANNLEESSSKYECELLDPLINCNRLYSDMLTVAEMTILHFPQEYLYSYCIYHTRECDLQSDQVVTTGGYAVTALTIALFISVVLYISLSVSNIREEADEGNLVPLAKFNIIATSITMFGFLLLLVGVVVFFFGLVRIIRVRSPLEQPVAWLILVNLYCMLVPTGIVFSIIAAILPWYALRDPGGRKKKEHTTLKQVSMQENPGRIGRHQNSDDEL